MKEELKPCPFCNASPDEIKVYVRDTIDAWVECQACHGRGTFIKPTKEEMKSMCRERAIEAWNRRA